jgi:RimJ/RimL family protein N-acetyltransferase
MCVSCSEGHDRAMSTSLDDIEWPLRSARLTIRPAGLADLTVTWRYRKLPSVAQWLTSCPSSQDEYGKRFVDPDRLATTLVIELDGVVIGDLMLSIEDAWAQSEVKDHAREVQAELGWCLSPDAEGYGYGTEAVTELIRFCFEDLGLRRVRADCFADNEASWRLMERVHMRREQHTLRESLHRSGKWLDGLGYALLAEEWRARRGEGHTGDEPARAEDLDSD